MNAERFIVLFDDPGNRNLEVDIDDATSLSVHGYSGFVFELGQCGHPVMWLFHETEYMQYLQAEKTCANEGSIIASNWRPVLEEN